MHTVLEFPAKIFSQWGAIAQEIVPYLSQRGVKRDEICAIVDRLRIRWEQLAPAPPGAAVLALIGRDKTEDSSGKRGEHGMHPSRHWRLQPARVLIQAALADHQRNAR